MKKWMIFLCVAILNIGFLNAQTALKDVTLEFNHVSDIFGMEFSHFYRNWDGVNCEFTRSQFYVSDIALVHNSGDTLDLSDTVLLANSEEGGYLLGQYDIGTLESIIFSIGVNADINHLDPALYAAGHPLSLVNPTMHWGWSAGYRFFAFEGRIDADQDNFPEKVFQYHGVGDQFYKANVIQTAGVENGTDLTIYVNVDYQNMFINVDMPLKAFSHGDGPEIQSIFGNMDSNNVFTAGNGPAPAPPHPDSTFVGISPLGGVVQIPAKAYPNPFNYQTYIKYDFPGEQELELLVADLRGQVVKRIAGLPEKGEETLQLDLPQGTYMYLFQNGERVLFQDKITLLR